MLSQDTQASYLLTIIVGAVSFKLIIYSGYKIIIIVTRDK